MILLFLGLAIAIAVGVYVFKGGLGQKLTNTGTSDDIGWDAYGGVWGQYPGLRPGDKA